MCDHSTSTKAIKTAADLKPVPTEPGKCHIYYVHQDGEILCEPNVQFQEGLSEPDKNKKDNRFCGEDRLTLVSVSKDSRQCDLLADEPGQTPSSR
jgi:hypothetical protein